MCVLRALTHTRVHPGLQTPVLSVNKHVFSEGEEVTVWCKAPEESGTIVFYFYDDSKELYEERVNANHVC